MSSVIYFNRTHLSGNSTFTFPLAAEYDFRDTEAMIERLSVYYSWYSISAEQGNNKFNIIIPTSSGTTTLNVVIPDGTYTVSALNSYIQSIMVLNDLYLINDATGDFLYFIEFLENSVAYAVQLNLYPIETKSGYTAPAGFDPPAVATNMSMIIPEGFGEIVGLIPDTYGGGTSNFSILSNQTPQLSPTSAIYVSCDVVDNPLYTDSHVMYSFTSAGKSYGQIIESHAFIAEYSPCIPTKRKTITIRFYDQTLRSLDMKDNEITVALRLRKKKV